MCFAARLLTRPASGSSSILTSRSTDRDKALHRLHDHAKVIQERLEKLRADRYLSCMYNVPSLPLKSTRLQTKITKVVNVTRSIGLVTILSCGTILE